MHEQSWCHKFDGDKEDYKLFSGALQINALLSQVYGGQATQFQIKSAEQKKVGCAWMF